MKKILAFALPVMSDTGKYPWVDVYSIFLPATVTTPSTGLNESCFSVDCCSSCRAGPRLPERDKNEADKAKLHIDTFGV